MVVDTVLDLDLARELTAQIVNEFGPDFCYTQPGNGACFYVPLPDLRDVQQEEFDYPAPLQPDYEPDPEDPRERVGCLVGTILDRWGGTEAHHTWKARNQDIKTLVDYNVTTTRIDREALQYLVDLQEHQDRGNTWGEAQERAEARLRARQEGEEFDNDLRDEDY